MVHSLSSSKSVSTWLLIKSWRFNHAVHSEEFVRKLVSLKVGHESIRVLKCTLGIFYRG